MDVKLNFTAVDNLGALASAASEKLEGVTKVIVLGSRAWMFSSEDINKTTVLRVEAYAEDRETHQKLSAAEDAAWGQIQTAIRNFATALIDAQMDRLKMVNAAEEREHQRLAKEEAGKIDHYVKKEPVTVEEMVTEVPKNDDVVTDGEKVPVPEEEDEVSSEDLEPITSQLPEKPAKKGRKK